MANTGNMNSGDRNSGNWNSGNRNSGNWNSGNWNSGNRNSGNWNSGNMNSGNWNSGNWNSGDMNSGNWNSGFFCTGTPSPTFFDQPVDMSWDEARELIPWIDLPVGCRWVPTSEMTDAEKTEFPNHATIGGYLRVLHKDIREAFPVAWENLDDKTKQQFLDLPNFDANKFLEITAVDVRQPVEAAVGVTAPEEMIVNGVRYVRASCQ